MNYKKSIVDSIGNTPLIKLGELAKGLKPLVLVKAEFLNPTGSTKDRIALEMINQGEQQGLLKPGSTIVEATGSGNTGISIATVAKIKGYNVVLTIPDKVSEEKRAIMKALGAELTVCPTNVSPDDPNSYYKVAESLAGKNTGWFYASQYTNQSNPQAHYKTTGPEIWKDTQGKITHFVVGIGTGGTISGVGRFLKEKNPNIKIIAPDPPGSIYYPHFYKKKMDIHQYKTEGIGEDFLPSTADLQVVDEMHQVTDKQALQTTREIAEKEGMMMGGSGGASIYLALEIAKDLTENDVVVAFAPDTGRNYMSKIFNDQWMEGIQ